MAVRNLHPVSVYWLTMADTSTVTNPANQRATKAQGPPWWALGMALTGAIILLLVYSLTAPNSSVVFAVELIAGLAALVGGALLGFLFGIPRTPPRSQTNGGAADGAPESQNRPVYEPSNNLEQVSDWLTKILVGAGLVQLEEMRDFLNEIGAHVGTAVGGAATGVVTQLTLLVFGILGFLGGFLWTRVYYGAIQVLADLRVQEDLDSFASRIAKRVQATVEQNVEQKVEQKVEQQVEQKTQQFEQAKQQAEESATQSKNDLTSLARILRSVDATASMAARFTNVADVVKDPVLADKVKKFRDAPPDWDSDPVKDLFGTGPSSAGGLTLTGTLEKVLDEESLILTLAVEGSDGRSIEGSRVMFLTHPTYKDSIRAITARGNRASLTLYSESWYYAAAIVDTTVLVLDLRTIPGVPDWFTKD